MTMLGAVKDPHTVQNQREKKGKRVKNLLCSLLLFFKKKLSFISSRLKSLISSIDFLLK